MISKRLREARETAGLSQEALSELTIISRSGVANYEAGRFCPSFVWVDRLAKALNYPTAYFYTEDDEFAALILQLHRVRNTSDFDADFATQRQLEIVTAELQEARKTIEEISKLTSRFIKK